MAGHKLTADEVASEERRYLQVFFWLGLLTAFELGVIYLPLSKVAIGGLLVLLALAKAALVAGYYMHLVHEKRTLAYIALTPLVLCVFLVFMLLPDLGAITRPLAHRAAPPAASAPH
jgi:cytochrome c oxidase subunit 4